MDSENKREPDSEAEETPVEETPVKETAESESEAAEAKPNGAEDDGVEDGGAAVGSPVVDDGAIPTVEDDAQHMARLEAEVAELKDQVLRQIAETQNVRRRLQRDKEDSVRYAAMSLVRDLLGAVDNLERALDSLPEGAADEEGPLAQLVAGLELTRKELAVVFERHDIVPVEAQGARLDPNRHEAMFEIQDPSVPSGTIVQVLQSGYMMHDRLVRAARVGIAKGGPPAAAAEPSSEPAPESAPESAAPEEPGESQEPANDDKPPKPGSHLDTEA